MNNSLKNMIQRLNESYIDDDELEEDNTTASLEPLNTPFAFSKKVQNPEDDVYSEPVHHTDKFFKQLDDIYRRVNEISYKSYKEDDSTSERKKINSNINLINGKLREVEQMINHASKLKLESGSDQSVFWKGTARNFIKIKERLNRLSQKLVDISS